jgi:hypothetical protein
VLPLAHLAGLEDVRVEVLHPGTAGSGTAEWEGAGVRVRVRLGEVPGVALVRLAEACWGLPGVSQPTPRQSPPTISEPAARSRAATAGAATYTQARTTDVPSARVTSRATRS